MVLTLDTFGRRTRLLWRQALRRLLVLCLLQYQVPLCGAVIFCWFHNLHVRVKRTPWCHTCAQPLCCAFGGSDRVQTLLDLSVYCRLVRTGLVSRDAKKVQLSVGPVHIEYEPVAGASETLATQMTLLATTHRYGFLSSTNPVRRCKRPRV